MTRSRGFAGVTLSRAHWLLPSEEIYFDRKVLSEKNVRIEDAVRCERHLGAGADGEHGPAVSNVFARSVGCRFSRSTLFSFRHASAPRGLGGLS